MYTMSLQNNNIRTFSQFLDEDTKRIKQRISYADKLTHIINNRKTPINTDYIKATTNTINILEASVANSNEMSEKMDDILGKIKVYKLLNKQVNAKYLTARKTFNNKVALRQTLGSLSSKMVRTLYPKNELTSPEKFILDQYLTPTPGSKPKSKSKSRSKSKSKSRGGTRKCKK